MKVLLAEDSPVASRMISEILAEGGYDADLYRDGNEAIDAIKRMDSPDILILDWTMPTLSGLEICEELTRCGLIEFKYILILSANSDKTSIAKILHAGADDYLTKPMNKVEFLARMKVAQRNIEIRKNLRQKTQDLEAYIERHLAGSSGQINLSAEIEEEKKYTCKGEDDILLNQVLSLKQLREFDTIISQNIHAQKLSVNFESPDEASDDQNNQSSQLITHGSVFLQPEDIWLDLIFETSFTRAEILTQQALYKNIVIQSEVISFFSDLMAKTVATLKQTLNRSTLNCDSYFEVESLSIKNRAPLVSNVESWITWQLNILGTPAKFHILPSRHPLQITTASDLHEKDILMENIRTSEESATVLLKKGIQLNETHIKNINKWANFNTIEDSVTSMRPSIVTQKVQALRERLSQLSQSS